MFQLYVVMAALSDRAIPCAYALLEHKRLDAYVQLLQGAALHSAWCSTGSHSRRHGLRVSSNAGCQANLRPGRRHPRLLLPPDAGDLASTAIRGAGVCIYKTDEDLRLFCGMLDGLAFLPTADVTRGNSFEYVSYCHLLAYSAHWRPCDYAL